MDKIMVSIIVPIYNGDRYLEECINSVLRQTYKQYEVILVDDGSEDDSLSICNNFKYLYPNIKVLHQDNAGQIAARKRGLYLAEGQYIAFIDCDDWIDDNYLENLVREIERDVKISLVSSDLIYERKNGVIAPDGKLKAQVYDRKSIEEDIMPRFIYDIKEDAIVMRHTLPGMLFEKGLLLKCIDYVNTGVRYDEDGLLVCNYLSLTEGISIVRYKGYHYRENDQSVTRYSKLEILPSLQLLKSEYAKVLGKFIDERIINLQVSRYIQLFSIRCLANEFECAYETEFIIPYFKIHNDSRIIVYGAGLRGRAFVNEVRKQGTFRVEHWIDRNYTHFDPEMNVESIEVIGENGFDLILIAIEDRKVQRDVEKSLLDRGVPYEKIWPLESKFLFKPRR